MSSCSLTSTPIWLKRAPSCGHTRSWSGSSWRSTSRGRAGSSGLRPRLARRCAGTSINAPSIGAAAGCACAPSTSASLKNRSFWCAALTSLLAANSWRLKRSSCSLSRSRSVRTTRNWPSASASVFFSASISSGVDI
jgi:hypothetical protein